MRTSKNQIGSSAALVVVLAFVLIIIGLGFFTLSMFFGGSRQVKNANDAGTLNIARKVADEKSVPLLTPDELRFSDVAGTHATMKNINRIWAKAFLIGLNAHEMGEGKDNDTKAYNTAKELTTRLTMHLRRPSNLKDFHSQFANANPLSMLGIGSKLDTSDLSGWSQSFMDRGAESNVEISKGQLPLNLGNDVKIPTLQADKKDLQRSFLIGYQPYKIGEREYLQVPYRFEQRPNLVSGTEFDKNRIFTPIWFPPNAFSAVAKAKDSAGLVQTAESWAQVNPGKTFKAAIPSGFIRIIVEVPTYEISLCDLISWEKKQAPGFKPFSRKIVLPNGLPCGWIKLTQYFGNEYISPFLYNVMFFAPPYEKGKAYYTLLQRARQINPNYDASTFSSKVLQLRPVSQSAERKEFFVCNVVGQGEDGTPFGPKTKLVAAPYIPNAFDAQPEGTMKLIDEKSNWYVNFGYFDYFCALGPTLKLSYVPTVTESKTSYYWQPGTGYNRCLGTLKVVRFTKAILWFIPCTCFPW